MANPFDVFDQSGEFDKFDQPETPSVQPVDAGEMSWGDALSEGATNIPSSAVQMGKNIAYPFAHPVEFGKNIGALLSGDEQAIGGMKEFLVNRYGGEEQLKNTVAQDPVGLLSDVALLFTGLGAGVKVVGALGQSAKVAGAGKALSKIGAAVDPVNAAASAVGKAVSGVGKIAPKLAPEGLYASTLKKGSLSSKLTPAQQAAVAKTGLAKDIPITAKGLQMTGNLIDDLDVQIGNFVETAAQVGDTVPRNQLLKALHEMKSPDGMYYHTENRAQNFRAIDKVMDNIRQNYPADVPVKDVQRLKQNTQAFVRKNYGKLGSTAIEAKKSLAYSARQALADKYPELATLNASSKELRELEKILEPAVARIQGRDVMGIGLPVKVGAGAAIDSVAGTGGAGATLGLVSGLIDTPAVKSWLARTLYKLREGKITDRKMGPYAVREGSRQAGRTSQQVQDQPEPVPY